MNKAINANSIQGKISNSQIIANEYLQKAMLKGDTQIKNLIKNASDITAHANESDTEEVIAANFLLTTVIVDQLTKENASLKTKVDFLLDEMEFILQELVPQYASRIEKKFEEIKKL